MLNRVNYYTCKKLAQGKSFVSSAIGKFDDMPGRRNKMIESTNEVKSLPDACAV